MARRRNAGAEVRPPGRGQFTIQGGGNRVTHVSGGQPTEQVIETHYQNSFGRIAGYLPADRAVERKRARGALVRHDSVADLARLIDREPVTWMYVS